ncbi:MAG TPA: AzlD domain-containing protein [Ktedonobacterales bacterium]|nr:AzlD domain-containing protein [Ktedonobacterales bacterium]
MQIDAMVAILGMAVATYVTRAGGLWLMRFVSPSPRVEAWLRHLPGAVLVALIAPAIVEDGMIGAAGALATALIAARTRNLLLSILVGVGLVVLLRHLV